MKQTVFVGLSGGVDSSVAALRLKKQGYTVVGVFIKVWHPDFLDCNWEAERLDAMRVAAHLDIPFLMCDAEEAYKNEVADYFIGEYKAGRTPNPDVMCNKAVKFGAFLQFALERGADFVATGHYAQNLQNTEGIYELHRGVDTNKDQSYFLWTLTQEQLAHILLPVGNTTKDQIRKEAEEAGIPVATKKDSQGVCFLGHIDIPDFLSHYIDLEDGQVLDEAGNCIGTHKGAIVYTTGQRHGFTINDTDTSRQAHYVVERDIAKNTITVSTNKKPAQDNVIKLTNVSFTKPVTNLANSEISFQTRYRQKPSVGHVAHQDNDTITLAIAAASEPEAASSGQSCVLYRDTECIGGGIIV